MSQDSSILKVLRYMTFMALLILILQALQQNEIGSCARASTSEKKVVGLNDK